MDKLETNEEYEDACDELDHVIGLLHWAWDNRPGAVTRKLTREIAHLEHLIDEYEEREYGKRCMTR